MQLKNRRPADELFDLKRLQNGDNDEWTMFMGYFYDKLTRYAYLNLGKSRFVQDAASNALADIYVARATFESVQHMVAYMFSIVRYECISILKGNGNFIMSDDMLIQMDELQKPEEELSTEERILRESWEDSLLRLIYQQSLRLPRRWRDFIYVYFRYGRHELRHELRANQAAPLQKEEREKIFDRLRRLIDFEGKAMKGEDQLDELKALFQALTLKERAAVAAAMDSSTLAEVASKIGVSEGSARASIRRFINRFVKIWPDPMGGYHSDKIKFLHSIRDPAIVRLLREEIIDNKEPPQRMAVHRSSKVGRHSSPITNAELTEIILLREQKGATWKQIGKQLHRSGDRVAAAYADHLRRQQQGDLKKAIKKY